MKFKEWIIFVLVFISVSIALWSYFSRPKIAFIRMEYILQNYAGTKQASELLFSKSTTAQQDIDSLKKQYESNLADFKNNTPAKSKDELTSLKEKLTLLQYQIGILSSSNAEKFKVDDEKMSLGIINQVNTFLKEYGEENDYAMILIEGATGNIAYGKEYMDITDNVLMNLNAAFEGNTESK